MSPEAKIDEAAVRQRLIGEEKIRDRTKFNYTYDGLPHLMTWNESDADVLKVISGEVKHEDLPYDGDNEMYKGIALFDQVKIVKANHGEKPLCEALEMLDCKQEECPLYIAAGSTTATGQVISVPLCREFKMAFRKR